MSDAREQVVKIMKEYAAKCCAELRASHDYELTVENCFEDAADAPPASGQPSLNERRAEFVYDAARLAAIAAGAPIIPVVWREREAAFRSQFLEVIEKQSGPLRSSSPEELHGTWMEAYLKMGWVYGEKYDREKRVHPDLVPYAELGQLERDKDAVFVALCEIARNFIYDAPAPDSAPSPCTCRATGVSEREGTSPVLALDTSCPIHGASAPTEAREWLDKQGVTFLQYNTASPLYQTALPELLTAYAAARCAELERQLAENHEEAHQAYNTAVARAESAEASAEKLRAAINNALNDSALQSVAGWYDSMKGLRAALAALAEEKMP